MKDLEWKPRGTELIVSTNQVDAEEDDLNLTGNLISEIQMVIAVGEHIRDIVPGDTVFLDMNKLTVQSQNSRDFDNAIVMLNVFPLPVGEFTLGVINSSAVKLIKE